MNKAILIVESEPERGCGFRQPGLYLRSDGEGRPCGRLPVPLTVCPCCVPPGFQISGASRSIDKMTVGEECFSPNGVVFVARTMKRDYEGDIVELKAEGLLPFCVTPEHPILAVFGNAKKGQGVKLGEPVWVEAKDLKVKKADASGHFLLLPILPGTRDEQLIPLNEFMSPHGKLVAEGIQRSGRSCPTEFPLNEESAWLLGLYVAEGSPSGKGIYLSCGKHEATTHSRVKAISSSLGYAVTEDTSGTTHRIEIGSRVLHRAMPSWCGAGCENKRVPDFILHHKNKRLLTAFLAGYESGDGCDGMNKGVTKINSPNTVSRQLAETIQLLYARLGFFARVFVDRPAMEMEIEGRLVQTRTRYKIVRKLDGERLFTRAKQDDYFLARVTGFSLEPYSGSVHNIETSDNTYLMSNAVVHNCGEGFKFFRTAVRMVDLDKITSTEFCANHGTDHCSTCPFSRPLGRSGLVWVGGKTPQKSSKGYPTPQAFAEEAATMGVSRRINSVPKEFVVGKTWVALAHVRAVKNPDPKPVAPIEPDIFSATSPEPSVRNKYNQDFAEYDTKLEAFKEADRKYREFLPGIFYLFRPDRLEVVLGKGEEQDAEYIDSLVKRGITPVYIKGISDQKASKRKRKPVEKGTGGMFDAPETGVIRKPKKKQPKKRGK